MKLVWALGLVSVVAAQAGVDVVQRVRAAPAQVAAPPAMPGTAASVASIAARPVESPPVDAARRATAAGRVDRPGLPLTDQVPYAGPTPVVAAVASAPLTASQADLLQRLNRLRSGAGARTVAEDARLSRAAFDHLAYLRRHPQARHLQAPEGDGFTGITVHDRIVARGYPRRSDADEVYVRGVPTPAACVAWLAGTVYHLGGLVAPEWRAAGVAHEGDTCVIVLADADAAALADGTWLQWPPDGGLAAARFAPASESPDPAPDLSVAGQPVLLAYGANAPDGAPFEVERFDLRPAKDAGHGAVPARLIVPPGTRVAPGLAHREDAAVRPDQVFLLPLVPLAPGTGYVVAVRGRAGGAPFERGWSFRTP